MMAAATATAAAKPGPSTTAAEAAATARTEAKVVERIIPITILSTPRVEKKRAISGTSNSVIEAKSTDQRNGNDVFGVVSVDLPVSLDDGSRTEVRGEVTSLLSLPEKTKLSNVSGGGGEESGEERLTIREIGEETLEREIRQQQREMQEQKRRSTSQSSSSSSTAKLQTPSPPPPPSPSSTSSRGSILAPPVGKIRLIPILLPDGKLVERDPDETMEIKTEFTNYCHQEFSDGEEGNPNRKSSFPPQTQERIVPIKLDNGDTFMPTFSRLEDLAEPPEWSAFSPKNRAKTSSLTNNNNEGGGFGGHKGERQGDEKMASTNNAAVPAKAEESGKLGGGGGGPADGDKETIVPIKLEEQNVNERAPHHHHHHQRRESPAKKEGSPSKTKTTTKTTTSSTTEKTTNRRKQEKQVRHTVRFKVDEDEEEERKKRSASLESQNRVPFKEKPARQRHQSGGGGGGTTTLQHSPNTEKTLNEIDTDINKIWKELQELDKFPPSSPQSSSSSQPKRSGGRVSLSTGSTPVRGATAIHPPPVAASVKVRTFNTPTPQQTTTTTTTTTSAIVHPNGTPARSSPSRTSNSPSSSAPTSSQSQPTSPYQRKVTPPRLITSKTEPLSQRASDPLWTTRASSSIAATKPPPPYHTSTPNTSYTPRRDLEPTRPGVIQPVIRYGS